MDYTVKMQREKGERERHRLEFVDKHPEFAQEIFQHQRADDERDNEYIFAQIQNPPQKNPPYMLQIE